MKFVDSVIPAKAGISGRMALRLPHENPAFAGASEEVA